MKTTYFISGHRDLTQMEFDIYYKNAIDNALKEDCRFIVGDYWGADEMAQTYLATIENADVTVYHMGDEPRNYKSDKFKLISGFRTDEGRDAAMTHDSDKDIAFVRKGRRDSGTAQNIIRRYELLN